MATTSGHISIILMEILYTCHILLQTLPIEQTSNCPAHLNTLVFIYIAIPQATTGHQHTNLCLDARLRHLVKLAGTVPV